MVIKLNPELEAALNESAGQVTVHSLEGSSR